jgi:hypothetical protein
MSVRIIVTRKIQAPSSASDDFALLEAVRFYNHTA